MASNRWKEILPTSKVSHYIVQIMVIISGNLWSASLLVDGIVFIPLQIDTANVIMSKINPLMPQNLSYGKYVLTHKVLVIVALSFNAAKSVVCLR